MGSAEMTEVTHFCGQSSMSLENLPPGRWHRTRFSICALSLARIPGTSIFHPSGNFLVPEVRRAHRNFFAAFPF